MTVSAPVGRVLTTLVTGSHAQAREDAIARILETEYAAAPRAATAGPAVFVSEALSGRRPPTAAILLEGLPAACPVLPTDPSIQSVRIAPGCVCCSGNLVLQVTLNRLLRTRPRRLFIALASTAHLAAIQDFLSRPPYDALLRLTPLVAA